MFATSLNAIEPLAGNRLFDRITEEWVKGSSVNDDNSMLATLRCLLHPRSEGQFNFQYYSRPLPSEVTDTHEFLFNATSREFSFVPNNTFLLINTPNSADITKAFIHNLTVAESNPWCEPLCKRLGAAEDYIARKIGSTVGIFVFADIDSVVILTQNLSMALYHLIQSFIPIYFPRLFKEHPMDEEEKNMLETLTQRSADKYLDAIAVLAARFDFQDDVIKKELLNFEKDNRQQMLLNAESVITASRQQADEIIKQYERALEAITEATIRYEGIRYLAENTGDSSDLVDYFLKHKNLKLVGINGKRLDIIVSTFLDSFDADGYEHIKRNRDIYRHYNCNNEFSSEDNIALFMDNIFNEDPLLKIKLCAFYRLDLAGSVSTFSDYDYKKFHEYANCIPNPHLQYHSCIGQNRPLIDKQLHESEIIGAIECCIASAMAVNIHETGPTFRPFMQSVLNSNKKIIYNTETKQDMTPKQALKWLKERQSVES